MFLQQLDLLTRYSHYPSTLLDVFCLTLGLSAQEAGNLFWSDIIHFDSADLPTVRTHLEIRKYEIPIHDYVQKFALKAYEKTLPENLGLKICQTYNLYETKDLIPLFGNRVIEVCGRGDWVLKKLKQHLRIGSNEQLFNRIDAKNSSLSFLENINLLASQTTFQLSDKNFNSGYDFQKFLNFYSFLSRYLREEKKTLNSSVRLLLLLSLFTGVRMSKLLGLKFKDIYHYDENSKTIAVKNKIESSVCKFLIIEHFRVLFLDHLEGILEGDEEWLFPNENEFYLFERDEVGNNEHWYNYQDGKAISLKLRNPPDLERNIFLLNNHRRIPASSLKREVSKALFAMGFKHWDKITPNSTIRMWGRRIVEIKGDDYETIKQLRTHLKCRTEKELAEYLELFSSRASNVIEYKGKVNSIFSHILYDVELVTY